MVGFGRGWSSSSQEADVICFLDVASAVGKTDRLYITLRDNPSKLAKVRHYEKHGPNTMSLGSRKRLTLEGWRSDRRCWGISPLGSYNMVRVRQEAVGRGLGKLSRSRTYGPSHRCW
jgi:hypothetical protein